MRKRSEVKARPQRERPVERTLDIETPHDVINEQAILAAMLVDQEACDRLLPLCPTDAFYTENNRVLREAIATARRKGLALDPVTLLRLQPEVDEGLIGKLRTTRPDTPENIDNMVDTLLWDRHRARMVEGPLGDLVAAVQNPKEDRDRLRSLARKVGEAFAQEHGQSRYILNPKEVVRATVEKVSRRAGGDAVYPFGIEGLDKYEDGTTRLRPGANPGGWTLVSALSGSGKSTLLAHLALALGKQRRKVIFGAWEEEAPVTLELLATLNLGWSRSRMLDGKSNRVRNEGDDDWAPMTHEDLVIFEEQCHKIARWVHFFDNPFQRGDLEEQTNEHHVDVIADHLATSGGEIFMADLLHRGFVDDSPGAEKRALFKLLTVMQDTKMHMIAAHQQRAKDIETRVDKRPTREGIIGAGAWLDIPWLVLAPHLPAKWKAVDDNTMEIYVLKQRQGPWPLAIEFDWDPDTGWITNGRSMDIKAVDAADETFLKKERRPESGRAQKAFRPKRRR